MTTASLTANLEYNQNRPAVKVLLETEANKEIRMVFKAGQGLKEHKTPFPIVVEVFDGAIDFGVNGNVQALKKGDLIALSGNVSHDLKAKEDSIVRLSLTKADTAERVEGVAKES